MRGQRHIRREFQPQLKRKYRTVHDFHTQSALLRVPRTNSKIKRFQNSSKRVRKICKFTFLCLNFVFAFHCDSISNSIVGPIRKIDRPKHVLQMCFRSRNPRSKTNFDVRTACDFQNTILKFVFHFNLNQARPRFFRKREHALRPNLQKPRFYECKPENRGGQQQRAQYSEQQRSRPKKGPNANRRQNPRKFIMRPMHQLRTPPNFIVGWYGGNGFEICISWCGRTRFEICISW